MPFIIAMLFFVLNLYVIGRIGDLKTKLGGANNVLNEVFKNLNEGDRLRIRQSDASGRCEEGFEELNVGEWAGV